MPNFSTRWKVSTKLASEGFDPPVDYKSMVQAIEDRAAGSAQIAATIAARDAIPTAELYAGKRVFVVEDLGEYIYLSGGWKVWNRGPTNYTPSLSNWSVGNGTLTGSYTVMSGSTVTVRFTLTLGSTSTMTGWPSVGLPSGVVNSNPASSANGTLTMHDISASQRWVGAFQGGTGMGLLYQLSAAPQWGFVGASAPFTHAAGDTYYGTTTMITTTLLNG